MFLTIKEREGSLFRLDTRGNPHPNTRLGRRIKDRLNSGINILSGRTYKFNKSRMQDVLDE